MSRRVVRFLGACCLLTSTAAGQQALDRAVLEQLKEATVYVRISQGGAVCAGGSGFVIQVNGNNAMVLTNHHVAAPDPAELPRGGQLELSVVFRSGTPSEQVRPATLIGSIHNETSDLALLEVKGVVLPPRPIRAEDTTVESEFFETMPVTSLGFPLGEMIQGATGRMGGNPAITVNSMSIGSLRRDPAGQLLRVQLNGAVIQGNSGGPVVDAKGRLVGVAVSRLRGEALGFAIPPRVIAEFLNGTLQVKAIQVVSLAPDSVVLKVEANLIDPFGKVQAVALRRAPASEPIPPPARPGEPPLVRDPAPVAFTLSNGVASSQFQVQFKTGGDRKFNFQMVMTDRMGRVTASSPVAVDVPTGTGPIARAFGGTKEPNEVTWSCDVNVANGCKIRHDGATTTFEVPGGTPFINAPQLPAFTAPAALDQVKGDFIAIAVVDCDFDPGGEPILGPNGKKLKITFQGAGLLLWQDEKNFVRIEKCKGSDGGAGMIHRVLFEVYKNGRELAHAYTEPLPEVPIAVGIVRKGASIHALFAPDRNSLRVFQELAIDFQNETLIGVSASNLSKRPLKARITGFELTSPDKQPIAIKPLKRKNLAGPEMETLDDGTIIYEGATLKVVKEAGNSAVPENDMTKYQGEWSGGRQLLWRATRKGDGLSLEFPVVQPGTYDIKLRFTKGPDYGHVITSFDGKTVNSNKPWNLYAPEVKLGNPVSVGTSVLAKGPHKLAFTIAGKDDQSEGYAVGIDDIRLVPVKPAAKSKKAP